MEQIRLYLDEQVPNAIAKGLRRRGLDILTVQEAGRSRLSDLEQLTFALAEHRVLLTMDSDFLLLAREVELHAGVAYANPSKSIGAIISSAMLLCDVLSPDEMMNHVEFL